MKLIAALALVASFVVLPAAFAQAPSTASTDVAIVVRISTPSLLAPDGSPAPDRDRRLQSIASQIDALGAEATVPLAIAPSAVMCDEALRLRGAAPKRFLRSLRKLASHSTVLATPFANVRIPDVATGALSGELQTGRTALQRCTSVAPSSLLYPPGLSVDDASANAAAQAGITGLLTPGVAVPVRGEPDLLPVTVATASDTPAKLLARRPSRTFAINIALSDATAGYVRAIAADPSFAVRTVATLDGDSTNVGRISLPAPTPPPVAYRRALLHADEAFARFVAFTARDNAVTAAYRDVLARARSSADLVTNFVPGRHLAESLSGAIARATRRVTVGTGSITFTSRRGSVPVTVNNANPYPVAVRIDVESPKLDFPDGDGRIVTVAPPGNTITFAAVARSTGSFPVIASVRTTDGSALIARGDITVRSTAANLPALAVTIGGFVLLVVFYLRRRRKREAT